MGNRLAAAVCITLALTVGAGLLPRTAPVRAQDTLKPSSAQHLLYQTNWRHGILGWSHENAAGWRVVNHQLLFDGQDESALIAPVRIPKGKYNYAIEASIRSVQGCTPQCDEALGVIVRDNILAGVYRGFQSSQASTARIWDNHYYPEDNDTLSTSDFDPSHGWDTYRLEVRGNKLRLFVDGQFATSTASNIDLGNRKVGLTAAYWQIAVRSFRVWLL